MFTDGLPADPLFTILSDARIRDERSLNGDGILTEVPGRERSYLAVAADLDRTRIDCRILMDPENRHGNTLSAWCINCMGAAECAAELQHVPPMMEALL
jgi:hypothetical protein